MGSEIETFLVLKYGSLTKAVDALDRALILGNYHLHFTPEQVEHLKTKFRNKLFYAD